MNIFGNNKGFNKQNVFVEGNFYDDRYGEAYEVIQIKCDKFSLLVGVALDPYYIHKYRTIDAYDNNCLFRDDKEYDIVKVFDKDGNLIAERN